jgi:hypothetical protein
MKHAALSSITKKKVTTLRTVVHVPTKNSKGTSPRTRWCTIVTNDPCKLAALTDLAIAISALPKMKASIYPG